MKLRAVIFDIYQTVLGVGPPPADREYRWQQLVRERFGSASAMSFAGFAAACDRVIAREHERARAAGILCPEIFWPHVVAEVLPQLQPLAALERDDFLLALQSLFHTVWLIPGVAEVFRKLRERRLLIGIASNAQPYTRRELDRALVAEKLSLSLFTPELCFWSFEHGFSKPDPHVFRLLTARLSARDVLPAQTLMVGDRLDNDIAPARAQGWQTWHLQASAPGEHAGSWTALWEFIALQD
jgi:FMN phosphatase YigB (HAD superfamily)